MKIRSVRSTTGEMSASVQGKPIAEQKELWLFCFWYGNLKKRVKDQI
jgi:hypothetical protein